MNEWIIVVIAFFGMLTGLAKAIMPHLPATITAWGNLPRNHPHDESESDSRRSSLPASFEDQED